MFRISRLNTQVETHDLIDNVLDGTLAPKEGLSTFACKSQECRQVELVYFKLDLREKYLEP